MNDETNPPSCDTCGDAGEIYTHTDDCEGYHCALAGGIDDCPGQVVPCPECGDDSTC